MSPPVNQSGTVSPATPRAHCMGNPTPTKFPEGPQNEGGIQASPGGPYPVSFRAIVPRAGECENLLVPVAVSASHIAYGSIRMEPVFMALGQSAATAAAMAIDAGLPVQQVLYAQLRERLLADGQVLESLRKWR